MRRGFAAFALLGFVGTIALELAGPATVGTVLEKAALWALAWGVLGACAEKTIALVVSEARVGEREAQALSEGDYPSGEEQARAFLKTAATCRGVELSAEELQFGDGESPRNSEDTEVQETLNDKETEQAEAGASEVASSVNAPQT